jgi:hypothetical protein
LYITTRSKAHSQGLLGSEVNVESPEMRIAEETKTYVEIDLCPRNKRHVRDGEKNQWIWLIGTNHRNVTDS